MSATLLSIALDSVDFDDEHFDRQYALEQLHEAAAALVAQVAVRLVAAEDLDEALHGEDFVCTRAGYSDGARDGARMVWRNVYRLITGQGDRSLDEMVADARTRAVSA